MTKRTKRIRKTLFKKIKKTKTLRNHFGGSDSNANINSTINSNINTTSEKFERSDPQNGAIDVMPSDIQRNNVSDKISNIATNAVGYLSEKGSRLLKSSSHSIPNIGLFDTINKGSVLAIEKLNDALGNQELKQTVGQAASETADKIGELFSVVNKPFENPEFKANANVALENASEGAELALKAMDKPIDEALDKLGEAGTKAISGAASGAVRVGTDVMAAIPGIGAIVEMGKIANDASKSASTVIEAGSDAVDAAAEFYENTKKNIAILEENRSLADSIASRANKSVASFKRPLTNFPLTNLSLTNLPLSNIDNLAKPILKKGGGRTRKGALHCKAKTKRVRFSI
jgi:hypothetical protein